MKFVMPKLSLRFLVLFLIIALTILLPLVGNVSHAYAATPVPGANTFKTLGPDALYQIDETGWTGNSQSSDAVNGWGDDQWEITLPTTRKVSIEVVDCCIVGDNYEVYVDSQLIGTTPEEPLNGSTSSQGTFTTSLAAGTHLITVRDPGAVLYYQQGNTFMIPAGYSVTITTSPGSPLLSVDTSVTPTTPLWNMDAQVSLDPTLITCPASLTVTIAHSPANMKTTVEDVCDGEESAPAKTDVFVPVFDLKHPGNDLIPLTVDTVTAQLTDEQNPPWTLDSSTAIPARPVWIGLGDSFSSGYHQESTQLRCLTFCGVVRQDLSFSWLSSAVSLLNQKRKVPDLWKMTVDMEAISGQTTASMVTAQTPGMVTQLTNHQGSWNVVSLNGGADDTHFGADLRNFYLSSSSNLEPWNIEDPDDCVNTEDVWQTLQSASPSILSNLQVSVSKARAADPNVRIAAVDYPYVLDKDNTCAKNYFIVNVLNKRVLQHGTNKIIDDLDGLYSQIVGDHIAQVDLRKVFGNDPLPDLQLRSDWGYPHANANGQQAIAAAAVKEISNL